jgi:hypothetical protein
VTFPHGVVVAIYAALAGILVGVIVAAGFGALNSEWVAATSAVVPILVAFLAASQQPRQPAAQVTATDLAARFAPQVLDQWTREARRRGLDRDTRMAVRWRAHDRSAGSLADLTERVGREVAGNQVPRLVITGEMGGGKTAACVLLVVEIAERHALLPVMFQLASWDMTVPLRTWMARQLPALLSGLGQSNQDEEVAQILIDRHIIPLLDGLDEVGDPAVALKAIDEEMRGQPFVLTCRTAAFAAANARHLLHRVTTVELLPLTAAEVGAILLDYEPLGSGGPLPTLAAVLDAEPDGALAAALSTPFMVSLARDARVSAAELPAGPDEIRQYLLGAYVRKSCGDDDRKLRYLRFLAQQTDNAGRMAWWRLNQAVPKAYSFIAALAVAIPVCSGLAAAFFALFDQALLGFFIGLGAAVTGACVAELLPRDPPRAARLRLRSLRVPSVTGLMRTLGFGLVGASVVAVMAATLYRSARYPVIGAVMSGLTYAAAYYVIQPNDPLRAVTPMSVLIADRFTVFRSCLAGAIPGAITGAYLGSEGHAGHRAYLDSLAILRYPSWELALLGAAAGFVLSGVGLGLAASGSSAWGGFNWTRIWLAFRGSTPLRLMGFLQWAYQQGILRQVNGYYEFRHQLLERYLQDQR